MNFTHKLKSSLALIICLSVVFSVFIPLSSFAADDNMLISDASAAYDFLKEVGAMDADEVPFDPSMSITRAHFVKLSMHLSNDAPKVLVKNSGVFLDVGDTTQYAEYIETAYRIGYIQGSGSMRFEPEKTITIDQSLKILCCILGYDKYAENMGGYPSGYYLMAKRIGLMDGIYINNNSELDMANAMLLLKNAANAELMQVVSFVGDNVEMKSLSGETLLYKRHGVNTIEGIINSNSYTDLLSTSSNLGINQVSVNDVAFDVSNPKVQNYLGYDVVLYYNEKTNKALYAEISYKNFVLEAKREEIEVSNGEILYYKDQREQKIKLSPIASYILNGKMAIMDLDDIDAVEKGSFTFISNDGDNVIDVVLVTKYTTAVVNGVSYDSNIIVTQDGTRIYLDKDCEEYSFSLSKNGKECDISSIECDDVLLISEGSHSGYRHIDIKASNKKITAAISEIGDEYCIINNKKYKLDTGIGSKIKIGASYNVTFDAFNNVSYVKVENDVVYGYLYAIAKHGMEKPQCRIFSEKGRWVDLYFADKVKYNGTATLADKLYTDLISDDYQKLVRYNVNDDAELIRLETYTNIPIGDEAEKSAIENDTFRLSYTGTLSYRNSPKSFNGVFFVDPNAIIFNIPKNLSQENFKVRSVSNLRTDNSYDITAYNVDKYLTSNLLSTYGLGAERDITNTDKFMIVESIGRVVNKNDEEVPSIRGWWNDSMISLPVKLGDDGVSETKLNSLQKGDVILFKYDEDSNVISVTEYPADTTYYSSSNSLYSTCTILGGTVSEIDITNKKIRLKYQADGKEAGIVYTATTTATIWDKNTGIKRPADISEIIPGDCLFVNTRYISCHDILIIRN